MDEVRKLLVREIVEYWITPAVSCEDRANRIIATLSAAGYAIVPREPTPEMVDAGGYVETWVEKNVEIMIGDKAAAEAWRAMVAAAEEGGR